MAIAYASTPASFAQAAAAPASEPAAAPAASEEEIVVLSPFTVSAQDDKSGYAVKDTLAGSRIRTELKDVGSAISVVNAQFLADTGARNNQDLLVYTTGTEVSGTGGNFAGLGNGKTVDDTTQRGNPSQSTRVRGLAKADNTRDFFLSDIPWDSFNVGRVDMQRGPNSILFGIGSPAGIVNSSVNAASFKDEGKVELRYGSYGSARASLDYNKVILDDELALRVDALDDFTRFRQKPAYNRDRRIFGALRFDPKFFRFDGARTTIRVNYEAGKIIANRPRILPPGDSITPWWTVPDYAVVRTNGGLNAQTLGISDQATVNRLQIAGDKGAGVRGSSTWANAMFGSFGRNYGGLANVFPDPTSNASHLMTMDLPKQTSSVVASFPWTTMTGNLTMKDMAVYRLNNDGTMYYPQSSFYKDAVIQDPSVFDFYNNLLDGPNKKEWGGHEAYNVVISQTFFNNRLGFEAVYDHQNVNRGQLSLMSEYGQAITIDMMNTLVDGSKNPNYGRAVVSSDMWANYEYTSQRTAKRFSAFGELRFEDLLGKTKLAKILGRHVFSGMVGSDRKFTENRGWNRYASDETYNLQVYLAPALAGVNTVNYLNSGDGTNLANRVSIAGANIQPITAVQINPSSGQVHIFDTTWTNATYSLLDAAKMVADPADPTGKTMIPLHPWTNQYGSVVTQDQNQANYQGWNNKDGKPNMRSVDIANSEDGARDALTTSASKNLQIINSAAMNWQGYFFDGVFVPSVGIRKDWAKSLAVTAGKTPVTGAADIYGSSYDMPDEASQGVLAGTSKSWSLVLHTPKSIRKMLPWNTGLTLFYNRSSNFQPAAGRIDVQGNPLAAPTGKTKDYGFLIETLNDRLSLKVNWYTTSVYGDALDTFGGAYMLGDVEAWGYVFSKGNLLRANVGGWADFRNGYAPLATDPKNADGTFTAAAIASAQAKGDAITSAYLSHLPVDLNGSSAGWYKLWGMNQADADVGNWAWANEPAGYTVTGDTVSKGVEFEITGQPTKNWNITFNASKTSAQRTNMAGALVKWIEDRWAVFNTPVMLNGTQVGVIGDVRFWNGSYYGPETLLGKFTREFMSGYYLYRLQEGADVPELRPWRFNLITSYSFDSGSLKGVNVGMGYRWQDKIVIGYPVFPQATAADPLAYDIAHPYYGKSETNIDAWIGYSRKLTAKIDWKLQLNLRNITTKKQLIPVSVQPDGSMAVGRISDPFSWTITNTFSF